MTFTDADILNIVGTFNQAGKTVESIFLPDYIYAPYFARSHYAQYSNVSMIDFYTLHVKIFPHAFNTLEVSFHEF